MGFMPTMLSNTKRILKHSKSHPAVPRGHVAVYVGYNEKKRYVVPLTYLSHPWFQELLHRAEEEFGFRHPMGGLTIPCKEEEFMVACRLSSS